MVGFFWWVSGVDFEEFWMDFKEFLVDFEDF